MIRDPLSAWADQKGKFTKGCSNKVNFRFGSLMSVWCCLPWRQLLPPSFTWLHGAKWGNDCLGIKSKRPRSIGGKKGGKWWRTIVDLLWPSHFIWEGGKLSFDEVLLRFSGKSQGLEDRHWRKQRATLEVSSSEGGVAVKRQRWWSSGMSHFVEIL